ncbi:glycosyltransferase [Microbacterium sp. NPDC089321]|uniref:glycosyltransferase n=1 Tax=Microbacterium sp. NPDC089321 TaxID=3155183 RepID=UPI003435D350
MTKLGALANMQGADAEYARRLLIGGHGNLETFTLQNRTRATRDAYALAISRGTLHYGALLARVFYEAANDPLEQSMPMSQFDPKSFFSLTRIMANQATGASETYEAVQMYKAGMRAFGVKTLSRTDRLIFLEAIASLGHAKDVQKYAQLLKVKSLDRNQLNLLAANSLAANRLAEHSRRPSDAWLDLVNAGYRESGIETISFAPGDDPLFDRILSGAAEHILDGPKVTVIVPTFNSGPRIATALRSLVNQTWRNLEILVMDDASPAENDRFLLEWQERDSRIRVHKMPENGGTYRARNFAVTQLATGEFITVHDDDDWSHPRKIETQVSELLADSSLVANMSLLSRATPELIFTRINNNPVFSQPNYSSLMFRRDPVVDEVGHWDLVNRSADAEFHDRLRTAYPTGTSVAGTDVLSFLRVRSGSLTSGEIARGYIDRRRVWYQQSSRDWHQRAASDGQSLFMPAFPATARPFSAPANMIGSKHDKGALEVDIVYVTDFRFPGGNSSLAATEIELLVAKGHRVALMQMASPVNSARAVIQPRFLAVSNDPLVSIVSPLDEVRARLTIVRHPSVLQYPEAVRSGVETDELVVIVNHAPFGRDGLGSIYDLPRTVETAEIVFGRPAKYAAESAVIKASLRGLVSPGSILSTTWPGIITAQPTPGAAPAPTRTIGRHSRDHALKWPETTSRLLGSYPDSAEYDVRILGGADTAEKILGELPRNWTVHEFGSIEPMEFLHQLPFWVYQHHSALTESFGMAAVEAMAAGCVVIMPPYTRPTFEDGAVYSEAEDVTATIDTFIAEPELYFAQRARAMDFVAKHFSPDAFYARIDALLA